jgi:6-phosphogluconolactonase
MPSRRDFADRDQLASALTEAVAADLKAGIASRGAASLAVSGGSTPAMFFAFLSTRTDVPWDKVAITLVDERWVDETSDRSNARLVKANLLKGPAGAARFVPLFQGSTIPDESAIARTNAALNNVPSPFDAVVLGMGNDGHTASFFPGGDTLKDALTDEVGALSIRAPGAGEPRVTLSLRRVLDARALYLHIEGEEKARTLERALAAGPVEDMPVRAVLRQDRTPVTIFWSP